MGKVFILNLSVNASIVGYDTDMTGQSPQSLLFAQVRQSIFIEDAVGNGEVDIDFPPPPQKKKKEHM
jgi:hypothetical protein